jgi:uncharacterized protein YukE
LGSPRTRRIRRTPGPAQFGIQPAIRTRRRRPRLVHAPRIIPRRRPHQLQGGNIASVTSGSHSFNDAGQNIDILAGSYRNSTTTQTSAWSGAAVSEYRDAAAQHTDGIAGLGQASTTTGNAIIGAGQVVAQAIAEVTELIAEAVAQIVPIMTQAMARSAETFGQSVAEAIPHA